MKAKSAFERYLSSHTFCATSKEQSTSGRQFVGCSGKSVKEISLFTYTRQIMQHSGLRQCCEQKKDELTRTERSHTVPLRNPRSVQLWAFHGAWLSAQGQKLLAFPGCTSPLKSKITRTPKEFLCLNFNPILHI